MVGPMGVAGDYDRFAEVYDDWYYSPPEQEEAVDLLVALAGSGRALELGIGTGRIALPMAERGVAVHGIDASEAMVAHLRAKPGGGAVPVTIGDFADVPVEGAFSLVFVVFNTFLALGSQDDQVRCFTNVASHLDAGGVFVIEAFGVDYPSSFTGNQTVRTAHVEHDRAVVALGRYDPVDQQASMQFLVLTDGGSRLYPLRLRYTAPAELDLMARLAGLRLRERWGGWRGQPFTAVSSSHVSVYERAPA